MACHQAVEGEGEEGCQGGGGGGGGGVSWGCPWAGKAHIHHK